MVRIDRIRDKLGKRKEKAVIYMVLTILIVCSTLTLIMYFMQDKASAENVRASSITIDTDTGMILGGDNIHARLPMASTTKIMTAYLAVLSGRLAEMVTIPKEAVGVEGSSIYLKEGEQYKLLDLVYGLMLRSGNDSAVAIACHLAGSEDAFVKDMNDKVAELGLKNTHFVNPHGLHNDNHYTSAYDLATIAQRAMQEKLFVDIVSSKKHRFTDSDGNIRVFYNKNKLLSMCEGAVGVKTGYTKKAGRCLVSAIDRKGVRMISVVLNHGDMWNDCISNFEKAINAHCKPVVVAKAGEILDTVINDSGQSLTVGVNEDIVLNLLKVRRYNLQYKLRYDKNAINKCSKGEKIGQIFIFDSKRLLFSTNIYNISNVSE